MTTVINHIQQKKASPQCDEAFSIILATTYSSIEAIVPSALQGLTSLFGMGRGVPPAL